MQGFGQATFHSAAQRGFGGVTIGLSNDLGVMFHNPAALQSLDGPAISVGGLGQFLSAGQVQQYAPVKYYSNLSLLLEGLTGSIPDPDSLFGGATAADTVQRPYDSIGPNWSSSKSRARPIQVFLGAPFEYSGFKFVAGAGAVEYADLNYDYQNNNVLTPSILSERPLPTPRPPSDANPTLVQWSQRITSRNGAVRGYGVALSGSLPEYDISVGVSGMLLTGSSDDFDRAVSRGLLTFYTNYFRLDSVYGLVTRTGRSEFSGREITLSAMYRSRAVLFGITVKPPNTISRKYSGQVQTEGTGTPGTSTETLKDRIILPWRGTAGLSIAPTEKFLLAIEYESRPYASADYKGKGGASHPWLSASLLRFGAAYEAFPGLVIRAGMRGQAEVFEPEGNPIPGEAVSYSVYSLGIGLSDFGFRLDVAYEYSVMKYQDVWGSAVSLNKTRCHNFSANLAYSIPEIW
jgi:hypothetical protein